MLNNDIIISFKQTSKVTEILDGGPMHTYTHKHTQSCN